jgi:chitodextrinase
VGVEAYDLYRGEVRVARLAAPPFRDDGLRAGERTCYAVVASDAAGNRSERSAEACLVAPDVTPPSPPSALEARLRSPAEAQLRWDEAADDVGVSGYEVVRGGEVVAVSRGTAVLVPGLAPARPHCFSVRALDAAGNRSGPGPEACLTPPDMTPPSAPSGLEAAASPGRIELRWRGAADDVGAAGYEVRREGAVVARGARTSAAEVGAAPASRRCYTVVALDAAGNRSAPSEPACATQPDVTPPSVPGGLEARADGETAVALRWNAARDDVAVVRYEVLREGAMVATAEGTQGRLSGLRPAVEYCQSVRACDAAGNCSAPSSPACVTTPDLTPPARVGEVVAEATSDRTVAVQWAPARDNVGVAHYRVRRGGAALPDVPGEATRLEDQGLSPATRYCYAVVAVDAAGNAAAPSQPACATTPDLVPPTVPPGVEAVARSASEVVVRWKSSTDDVGVAGYEVLRDGQVVARASGNQALIPGLGPAAEWCHAVRAHDAAGNRSGPSALACARTAAEGSPTAPSGLAAHVTPQGELLLTWEPSPDPRVSYVVYWDARGKGERRAGATPTTSFKVFGKAAAERHCYRVSAVDADQRESPRTFSACGRAGGGLSAEVRQPGADR